MNEEYEATEKWLRTAIDKAIHLAKRHSTNYCIASKTGVLYEASPTVCHSGIGTPRSNIAYVGTEIGIRRRLSYYPTMDGEIFEPLLDYLLEDELWAKYIVNRDPSFCREYGLIVSSECPQNVLMSLMVASRMFIEASVEAFALFNAAVKVGLHPRIAFIYAFHVSCSFRDYTDNGTYASPNGTNRSAYDESQSVFCLDTHRPWTLYGMAGLKNAYEGKCPLTKPYAQLQCIYGTRLLWGSGNLIESLLSDETFKESLRTHRKGKAEVSFYKPPNPFSKKAAPVSSGISFEEYSTVVLDHLLKEFPA